MSKLDELFKSDIKVINMGLKSFANDLKKQNIEVMQVDWRPPAGGNKRMLELLNKLKSK